jgi:hypothetical protein
MQQSQQSGLSAAWGPSNLRERFFSHGRSSLTVRDIHGQVFLLVLPHTIGVRYRTAGSSRLKKHASVITDVGSYLIYSREIRGSGLALDSSDKFRTLVANEIRIGPVWVVERRRECEVDGQ